MRYLIHSYPRTGSTALIYLLWRYKFQNINETTLSPIFNEILDYRPVKKDKTISDLYQLGIPPVDTMHPTEYLNQLEEVLNEDFDNVAIKNFPRYHEIYSHETSKFCHFINDKFDLTTVALYRRDVLDTALSYALASANGVWNINNFHGIIRTRTSRTRLCVLERRRNISTGIILIETHYFGFVTRNLRTFDENLTVTLKNVCKNVFGLA